MATLTHEAIASNFGSLHDWQSFVSLYSIQITVGAVLSALTIYRKQLSSNRCFHEDDDDEEAAKAAEKDEPSRLSYEFEMQAEALLDGAGLYCSGAPILYLLSNWLECFPGDDVEGKKLWLQQEELSTSDLLEKAGNYCSVELIEAMLLFFHKKKDTVLATNEEDRFTHTFPPDIHVHIASFLHPKDVTTLSCVSKQYNEVVSNSETSKQIWRSLWMRDFSWLVTDWDVGIQALRRSKVGPKDWENMDKAFYFMFRQTFLNWIIAGENSMNRCLVGLHGNIYDISSFLNAHPGSPDTLMAHSGQDATRFFEDINHSNGARRLAKSLCVVLDLSSTSNGAWGVRPTSVAKLLTNAPQNIIDLGNPLLQGRTERKGLGTLSSIKERMKEERKQVERRVAREYASNTTVLGGQVNTYYDVFRSEWRVWYTNSDLQNIFAPA